MKMVSSSEGDGMNKKWMWLLLVFVCVVIYLMLIPVASRGLPPGRTIVRGPDSLEDAIFVLFRELDNLSFQVNQQAKNIQRLQDRHPVRKLTVTAYTASRNETDSTPQITAAITKVKPYDVAVSRDLFWRGWAFGKKIYIEGHGVFRIVDLMNPRYRERVDIYLGTKKAARKFGKRELLVALLDLR